METQSPQFAARAHALLFASIARAVLQALGPEEGAALIRAAVRTYGEQRGRRMALRARANGHRLSVANYFVYGEWQVPPGEMEFAFTAKKPHARLNVARCPWFAAWQAEGLLKYGRIYCQEVDGALVRGFNPDLVIEVKATRTNDDLPCNFLFKDANLTILKQLGLLYRKKINPGHRVIMPWDYHTGHLYDTLAATFEEGLGNGAAVVMEAALQTFAAIFSREHVTVLENFRGMDFDGLPS